MSTPGSIFDGDNSSNYFYGTRGDDSISGAGGEDALHDSMGNDVVFGGDGNDTVYICLGSDWYDGGDNDADGDTISFIYLDIGPDGVTRPSTCEVWFSIWRINPKTWAISDVRRITDLRTSAAPAVLTGSTVMPG